LALGALRLETIPPDPRGLPVASEGGRAFAAITKAGFGPGIEVVVHRPHGPVTEPVRLRAEQRLERQIARLPGVRGVAGPGALGSAVSAGTDRQMASVQRGLRRARDGLAALRRGLQRAGAGATLLADGNRQAGSGATRLADGVGRAGAGSRVLAAGVGEARGGARRLSDGLGEATAAARALARGAARLREGSARTATGAAELADALRRLVPGLTALREGLAGGATGLDGLREPAVIAAQRAQSALEDLRAMTVGLADPAYRRTVQNVGIVVGALTGRDPRTGATLRSGYGGLEAELATARDRLAEAADGASQLVEGGRAAARGARALRRASRSVAAGLGQLRARTAELAGGLTTLADGAGAAGSGLTALSAGGGTLGDGLEELRARTSQLASGLGRLEAGQVTLARRLREAAGRLRTDPFAGQQVSAPALLLSGYAPLAALDTAGTRRRAAGRYVLDLDRGGATARILVLTDLSPTDRRAPELVQRVQALVGDFAGRTGQHAAVGGLATQLVEFSDRTNARLAFAIVFALSIDYQVFLLARMREGFVLTQHPDGAIRFGIEHTGRIVTGAALIMLGVFVAFATTDVSSVQQFGVGLGAAILIDATLVRLVLLPAVLRLVGLRAWWLPDRMERRLPELDVEGVAYVRTRADIATRAAELW